MIVDRVPLDDRRVENAKRRANLAVSIARYHERQAAAEWAKAAQLAQVWGFNIDALPSYEA